MGWQGRREWRNGSRTEGDRYSALPEGGGGLSIKGDKTILEVSKRQSPLLPPKLWCNWSCSGFGVSGV